MSQTVRRLFGNDYSFGQGRANLATGLESVLQRCKTHLMQLQGEWFLDVSAGIAWAQVLGRRYEPSELHSLVLAGIMSIEGVLSVESLTVSFNRDTRSALVLATINSVYGSATLSENISVLE